MSDVLREMAKTSAAEVSFTGTNASLEIVQQNDYRVALLIANSGDSDIYLSLKNPAVAGVGIRLPATANQGPSFIDFSLLLSGRLLRGPIFAFLPTDAKVTIWESLHTCPCERIGLPGGTNYGGER